MTSTKKYIYILASLPMKKEKAWKNSFRDILRENSGKS